MAAFRADVDFSLVREPFRQGERRIYRLVTLYYR